MRVALRLKRRFDRDAELSAIRQWLRQESPRPEDEPSDREVLALVPTILRPPEGRLGRWLWEQIANRHRVDPVDLEKTVFGCVRARLDDRPRWRPTMTLEFSRPPAYASPAR